MSDVFKDAAEAMRRGSMQHIPDSDEQIDWRNVDFSAPPSASPHGETQMERLDHDQAEARAENIRLAIAQQPTVEQGVAALFQAISTAIHNAVEKGDAASLLALAKHVDGNARDWSDAILANTQAAPMTAGPRVPEMPLHVQDAFKSHGTLQHDAERRGPFGLQTSDDDSDDDSDQARPDHPPHPAHPPHPEHPPHPAPEPDEPTPEPAPAAALAQAPLSRSEQARRRQNEPAMKA